MPVNRGNKCKGYKCRVCGMIFKMKSQITWHMFYYHIDPVVVDEDRFCN